MKIVEFQNVSKSYQEAGRCIQILNEVNFVINQGDFIHLRGDVGAGKTSLIELITGIEEPDTGEVNVFGRTPKDSGSRNFMGIMNQKIRSPKKLKVEEMIDLFRSFQFYPLSTEELLNRSDLKAKRGSNANSSELSGGEERRLHFALAIAGNPDFLILDEPTANLAPEAVKKIFKQLREFYQQGRTILVVTHAESDLEQISDLVTRELHLSRDEDGCHFSEKNVQASNYLAGNNNSHRWKPPLFLRIKKTINSLLGQVKIEFLQLLRNPLTLFGILALYCFTAALHDDSLQYLIAIIGGGLLLTTLQTFGLQIAEERSQGWLESLRTTPLPAWVYLAAKVVVALILVGLGIVITFSIGIFHLGIHRPIEQWTAIALCLLTGVIPLAMLGFSIAHLFNAQVISLVFLPVIGVAIFTSNCLQLPGMPIWLQNIIPFSPFYHYSQLVMWAGNFSNSGIELFDGYLLLHVEWMIWVTTVMAIFAIWAYRQNRSFG